MNADGDRAVKAASSRIAGSTEVFPADVPDGVVSEHLTLVESWLRGYISQPAADLGRTGPVCPFVPPAMTAESLRIRIHYGIDGIDPEGLMSLVSAELHHFLVATGPRTKWASSLDCALVVLPDAQSPGRQVIDACYPKLKELAVSYGAMIGQFHPQCDERAVRNQAFRVSVAPVTVIALRHMAVHDILFLQDDRSNFEEYHIRFGPYIAEGRVRDALLLRLYAGARGRFGFDEITKPDDHVC